MSDEEDTFGFVGSVSSTGSVAVPPLLLTDVLQAVNEARDAQNLQTEKIVRAISDTIRMGVGILIAVMFLCTLVLYMKPTSNTTCESVMNHTKYEPVNKTTLNIVVHVHVNGKNGTSFIDTPEDQCSIDDKKIWDLAE